MVEWFVVETFHDGEPPPEETKVRAVFPYTLKQSILVIGPVFKIVKVSTDMIYKKNLVGILLVFKGSGDITLVNCVKRKLWDILFLE